jgi:pyruvate/2-oxoglutarate dehydrogenase complex dihydrolipoamide acyltransferase (E2) component
MSAEHLDIQLPVLGHGLDEALLVEWVAAVGDHIDRGDVVALIETDKASTEILAERDGHIAALVAAAGTILRSGDVLYQLTSD